MLEAWAKAYAERWGLPEPALDELAGALSAAHTGDFSAYGDDLLGEDPDTDVSDYGERPIATVKHPEAAERYEDIGFIGMGGMGEVRRVWDCTMNRSLAMKILRREYLERPDLIARFREEAEATAQLEHPCVVPIYDLGELPDTRLFFTMKEVRGRTLLDVIDEVHNESIERWSSAASGWTLVKLVQVFVQICECMAYAHSRAVLHRDLKPSNVMVGAFGEVAVMDWGLAKIKGMGDDFGDSVAMGSVAGPVVTERSREGWVTRVGSIAGTPNYMPPEQATAEHSRVGTWSDVYALGAILYHIIADRPPYPGTNTNAVVKLVLAGPPEPPVPPFRRRRPSSEAGIEQGLVEICEKAMARNLADRYMDAMSLADAVKAWLDSAQLRERALKLVNRADRMLPGLTDRRRRARAMRNQADLLWAQCPPNSPVEEKADLWTTQDEATQLEAQLRNEEETCRNLLVAALAWVPDLSEARERLEELKERRPTEGSATVSLKTDPSDVRLMAHPVVEVGRLLVEREGVPLEPTPLEQTPLPAGTWVLRGPGLCYPLHLTMGQHWSAQAPGASSITAVPTSDPVEGARWVPAGWADLGDERSPTASLPPSLRWVAGFQMQQTPVTCGAFLAYLRHLDESGETARAENHAPSLDQTPLWHREGGVWALPKGWDADQPVRAVTWEAAWGYAGWWSDQTGVTWRLPTELEWEKAARGVDGRQYPWGNHTDPNWCCVGVSHPDRPQVASVNAFPQDRSIYGIRGLGGNVRDWCIGHLAEKAGPDTPEFQRVLRGGHWVGPAWLARSCLREVACRPAEDTVGFRLVHVPTADGTRS